MIHLNVVSGIRPTSSSMIWFTFCNLYPLLDLSRFVQIYHDIIFNIAGTSFKFLDQFFIFFYFQQFKSCVIIILNCPATEIEIFVCIKINICSNDFQIHFICKFIQSFWMMLPMKKQEMHLFCSYLLNLATCMDVKSILHKKFLLFTLTMINRKWQCLNKLTSKWLNHRINTDMQELENVLLEVVLKSQRRCWPLTCVNYWFSSIECSKLTSFLSPLHEMLAMSPRLELDPAPHMFDRWYGTKLLSSEIYK